MQDGGGGVKRRFAGHGSGGGDLGPESLRVEAEIARMMRENDS